MVIVTYRECKNFLHFPKDFFSKIPLIMNIETDIETKLKSTKTYFFVKDKKFILLLLTIDGVGRKTAKKIIYYLIKYELSFDDFWVNRKGVWQKCRLQKRSINSINSIKKEQNKYSIYNEVVNKGIRVVAFWEKEYPNLLKQCDDFPLILFVKGNISCLNNEMIGIVGTRRITSYGRLATKKIVESLVLEDYSIISGFMYGVDICAHLETIENGGTTVAVLGFGFNYMYPRNHEKYFNKVIESGGCFITEYLPNTQPSPGNFPTRNRIVAGMSKGVVVIEAAKKSGSHITAECAINEGREVFAVPGPINNPFSEGTKYLINQGAKLITSGNDVVTELRGYGEGLCPDSKQKMGLPEKMNTADINFGNTKYKNKKLNIHCNNKDNFFKNLKKNQQLIVKTLEGGPTTLDSLMEIINIDVQLILKEITFLEINNIIKIEDNNLSLV